jgi:CRP-like cAMP-binding protein
MTYALWALILGGISAVSLPMGSVIGLVTKPKAQVTASLAAFGAGALLAALSVELVAPTMLEVTHSGGEIAGDISPFAKPVALIIGGILGGIVFVMLDQIIVAHGGYLRKTATAITYMSHRRTERIKKLLQKLCQSEFFRSIPVEHIQLLIDQVRPVVFNSGDIIFHEGDAGEMMFFIEEGEVEVTHGSEKIRILKTGDVLGEIAVVTGTRRTAKAQALSNVKALLLTRQAFQQIRSFSPEFEAAAIKLASDRLEQIIIYDTKAQQAAAEWASNVAKALRQRREVPTLSEIRSEAAKHPGAPLAIWLGILLDGIPESFVIGANFLAILSEKAVSSTPVFGELINYTLIAGLFLSNFPEAMSSSIMMRNQNLKLSKIFLMWLSIMLMTAFGSAVGYGIGTDVNPILVTAIQGLAAGSMLTMIAQTMIPEAVHLGGANVVGLSTLMGFLSAVAFKLLQVK